jgi:hypothetical protein
VHKLDECAGTPPECAATCNGGTVACTYPIDNEPAAPVCTCDDGGAACREAHAKCDGAGMTEAFDVDCAGYRCASESACMTTCSNDGDCIVDYIWAATSCASRPPTTRTARRTAATAVPVSSAAAASTTASRPRSATPPENACPRRPSP